MTDVFEVWRRGVRLEAVFHAQFCFEVDIGLKRAAQEIGSSSPEDTRDFDGLFRLMRQAQDMVLPDKVYWRLENDMWPHGDKDANFASHLHVLSLLQVGVIQGVGYRMPRETEGQAQLVPMDLWHAKVDWHQDRVSGHGLAFTGVRVVPPLGTDLIETLPLTEAASAAPGDIETARPGRPSRRNEIINAYRQATETGEVSPQWALNRQVSAIMRHLRQNTPDEQWSDVGLSEDTVRRTIKVLNKSTT